MDKVRGCSHKRRRSGLARARSLAFAWSSYHVAALSAPQRGRCRRSASPQRLGSCKCVRNDILVLSLTSPLLVMMQGPCLNVVWSGLLLHAASDIEALLIAGL